MLAAKLDVTSADNGQNTRQNSTIPFSLWPDERLQSSVRAMQFDEGSPGTPILPSGQFVIDYKTQLPNGQIRQVHAFTTVSASGNELTGTATVKLLNRAGSVVDTKRVTVTGQRITSRLAAKP
jgi:hypothetical protein